MPHLDTVTEIEKRVGRPLTAVERKHLDARINAARVWVERFAAEEEKTHLQAMLPKRAEELNHAQRAFLHALADALLVEVAGAPETPWEDDALQAKIFEVARLTPIEQPVAFKAIYRVLLDKEAGPKAGNLLAFLEKDFVVRRFRELPFDKHTFWRESAISMENLEKWIEKEKDKIASQSSAFTVDGPLVVNEFTFMLKDGKRLLKRVIAEGAMLS